MNSMPRFANLFSNHADSFSSHTFNDFQYGIDFSVISKSEECIGLATLTLSHDQVGA